MAIWGIQRGVGNEIWGDMGDLRNVQFVTDFGDFLRLKRHFWGQKLSPLLVVFFFWLRFSGDVGTRIFVDFWGLQAFLRAKIEPHYWWYFFGWDLRGVGTPYYMGPILPAGLYSPLSKGGKFRTPDYHRYMVVWNANLHTGTHSHIGP